jgi:3-methyladenine DNA glycosylase AlkD
MNAAHVLEKLESLGTAQNRKVYARHGVTGPQFGVSFAHLGKLAREIGQDHELALALWASGNHDARVLATMIADPARMKAADLEAWATGLENYVLTDAVAKVAARSRDARKVLAKWSASKSEWTGAAGWGILAWMLGDGAQLPDVELAGHLRTIEAKIHASPNRVRYAMNGALIGIGVERPSLRPQALGVARRIGTVEVDHGETGCKTPDAAAYIAKVVAHRSKKSSPAKKSTAAKKSAPAAKSSPVRKRTASKKKPARVRAR